jgi:organic hydroperoxide reductase OsmC/OhrA
MTKRISVSFGVIAGSQAGLGRAGSRSLIVDRPEGMAGGAGLGFSGGELLAAALGGCLWNDLHYLAHAAGIAVSVEGVEAAVELAGNPPRVVRAHVTARLSGAPDATMRDLFAAAQESSTIASSLAAAFPIHYEQIG